LERQKGGIGLRGPGETQLETDRRLIGNRIRQLHKRLGRVRKQRDQSRRSRHKAQVPTVSLVGYTNAGKSTLFNRLTAAQVLADNRLFATLDPTLRRLQLAKSQPLVLADTVGFIRNLPHSLVEAFRSTLEETRDAALLLHVVDAFSEERLELIAQVNKVLHTIGAEDVPQLEIYNKIDRIDGCKPRLERDASGRIRRVWLSAVSGEGIDLLRQALAEYFPAKESIANLQQMIHAY
jgi:GTP-binding protein HflX